MTDDPVFPDGLPDAVRDELEACSPADLRQLARYADALADRRDQAGGGDRTDDETEALDGRPRNQAEDQADERPTDVPAKATVTIKEINDNRYYYWQWREGDQIKSKYKGPVSPDE